MATDIQNKVCGLAILASILSWTIPFGEDVEVSSNIEQLSIKPPESHASFMLRCSDCDEATIDARVITTVDVEDIQILNNCSQVVSYIATTTKEVQQHQQKNQNNEYKMFPVLFFWMNESMVVLM